VHTPEALQLLLVQSEFDLHLSPTELAFFFTFNEIISNLNT
jgi:hypothetical protein